MKRATLTLRLALFVALPVTVGLAVLEWLGW